MLLACLLVGASSVHAEVPPTTPPAIEATVVQQATPFADAATITLRNDAALLSEASILNAAGCCDQGYEVHSATEVGCCDQGYQVHRLTATSKLSLAVAFFAFLALIARRIQQPHTLQFRQ